MDAPTYPPSQAYEPPRILPQAMSTRTSSMADFLANPRAMDILATEAPAIRRIVKAPMLVPYLGNMSPREFEAFGALNAEQLDRVDARLRAEGLMQGESK